MEESEGERTENVWKVKRLYEGMAERWGLYKQGTSVLYVLLSD